MDRWLLPCFRVYERFSNPVGTLSVEQARAKYPKRGTLLGRIAYGSGVSVESVDVTIGTRAGPIAGRIYRGGPGVTAPRVVYFHGGGFVIGGLETHDAVCRRIARRASANVLAVDYRLAPEHPYPAAIDDAWDAVRWACAQGPSFGVGAGPLFVAGDSAGGNLSAVVAVLCRDNGDPVLAGQILIYPNVTPWMNGASFARFAKGPILHLEDVRWYLTHYLGSIERSEPLHDVLRAPDLSGVAPALFIVAGRDPLRDEAHSYEARLREAGVATELHEYADSVHGFVQFLGISRASHDAIRRIAEFVAQRAVEPHP